MFSFRFARQFSIFIVGSAKSCANKNNIFDKYIKFSEIYSLHIQSSDLPKSLKMKGLG